MNYVFLGYYGFVLFTILTCLWSVEVFPSYESVWAVDLTSQDCELNPIIDCAEHQDGIFQPPGQPGVGEGEPGVGDDEPSSGDTFRGGYINEQDAFTKMHLPPSDVVGGEHGYPIEGMRSGGYIPLPYSQINGIDTNEGSRMNA